MPVRMLPLLALMGGLAIAQPAFSRQPHHDGFRPSGASNLLLPRQPLIDQQREAVDTRNRLSPADAARDAQHRYGGRVLNVSPMSGGYRVKLLNGGDVRVVFVPDR